MSTIRDKIIHISENLFRTKSDFATAIGVKNSYISNVKSRESYSPTFDVIQAVMQATNISAEYFFSDEIKAEDAISYINDKKEGARAISALARYQSSATELKEGPLNEDSAHAVLLSLKVQIDGLAIQIEQYLRSAK